MTDYNKGTEQWKSNAVKNYLDCIKETERNSKEYRQLIRGMEILMKYDIN